METAVSVLPLKSASAAAGPDAAPPASRGTIVMMAVVAGAVITNLYCIQPVLPLIAADLGIGLSSVDLVAGAALLGFATGLALLLPLGDRYDRRKLVLAQIALAHGGGAGTRGLGADGRLVRPGRGQLRAAATGALCRRHVPAP
jgi:MFS family permease